MNSNTDLPGKSKAQIHLIHARDEIAAINGIPPDLPVLPVRSAAVVGAGNMGTGIATAYANVGIPILLMEASHELLDKAFAAIAGNYEKLIRKGRLSESQVAHRLDMIRPAFTFDRLSGADIVMEAVPENLSFKRETLARLETVVRRDTILATSTSTLDIDALSAALQIPSRLVGLHFPEPAHLARVVEIVRGRATTGEVVASSFALAQSLNKTGVVVGNCRGFAGNRAYVQYLREAQFLAQEGAAIEEIDNVLRSFGMTMGPFAAMDDAGLDIAWQLQRDLAEAELPSVQIPSVIGRLCQQGRFGKKSLAGWYRYEKGDADPRPDPVVGKMIEAAAREDGVQRRGISPEEILERTIYALINEGAKLLQEGIVQRASALDILYTSGYGFPESRGGPMWFADEVGLAAVRKRIREFERQCGPYWNPAQLLERLADEGKGFSE